MRNPNGYGSVYKLSGKRRRPFIVRITVGWGENGKQLYETLGYYASQPAAIKALSDYNQNPYDIGSMGTTFAELYEKWFVRKTSDIVVDGVLRPKISDSNISGYKMAFNISAPLHDLRFVDIRTDHMQEIIDKCGKGHDTLRKIKVLYNQLYDYAMEFDVVKKNYSDYIRMPSREKGTSRSPFKNDEIDMLWNNIGRMDFIDTILIMIYTGLRPGELVLIKNSDIHLGERYMRGGIKTPSGKNRVIPINKKIHSLIKNRMNDKNEFFVANTDGRQMSYYTYYDCKFKPVMEQLRMSHTPHECRHTFATLMDNAGANKLSIKRIMGHASQDITDDVYTHKDIAELIKAIDMI